MNPILHPVKSARAAFQRVRLAARLASLRNPARALDVLNRYEAGLLWQNGERRAIRQSITDARLDADQATRSEMLRKARYFEANSPLVQRLADIWEQYVVGSNGLIFLPDSSDDAWNEAARQWLEEWQQFPDLLSLQNWATLQSMVARSWFVDGEVFLLKTRGNAPPYFPRVQVIESHRVGTPPDMAAIEGRSIVDGVQIDTHGRPTHYHVQTGFDSERYEAIPAANMVHVFEPVRPGMYRGLTHLYAVMNTLHDLDDLAKLEMQAAKDAAKTTEVIKTPSGEAPDDAHEFLRDETSEAGAANPLFAYYKQVFGASTKILKVGDEYEQHVSQRPSVAQQWYWKYLAEQVCLGSAGVPLVMVYPDSLQGTVYRGVLDMAAVTFRSRSTVMATALSSVVRYALDSASRFDRRIGNKPPDWYKLVCRPPRSPNVDVGRNSTAMLAELEANTRTLQDIYAETGDDWKQKLRQRAKEKALIKELGLEPSETLPAMPSAAAG